MSIRIIVDSCCDFTPQQKEYVTPIVAPLIVTVDGVDYVDDGTVDIPILLNHMARSETTAKSTCPSPEVYAAAMRQCEACFVVTLSSELSGSNNAAHLAKAMVLEEFPEKKIHICDSLSASVAETHIALFLTEKINEGLSFEEIIPLAEAFKHNTRTFFVLEDLSNLFKNGRMLHVAGRIASMIRLCPVMGEDGQGQIKLVAPSLGVERSLRKLTDIIVHYTADMHANSARVLISFCNCLSRAEQLKERLLSKCPALKEVTLIPTGALSSMYANDGGIILAL